MKDLLKHFLNVSITLYLDNLRKKFFLHIQVLKAETLSLLPKSPTYFNKKV